MVTIAQLSDLHLTLDASAPPFRGLIDPATCVQQAVDAVLRLDPLPDACLLTGDLAERGHLDEYRALRALCAPIEAAMPVYAIAGNHDDRDAMRAAYRDCAWMPASGPIQHAASVGPVRLVMCDSVLPGHAQGGLDASRLAWIDACLAEAPAMPTIIAIHHPPFAIGIPFMDRLALCDGAAAFEALVRRHAQIVRVVCGHVHRAVTVAFGGTIATTAPSTAHQIPYETGVASPEGFTLEPPSFALHRWHGQRLATHVLPVKAARRAPY